MNDIKAYLLSGVREFSRFFYVRYCLPKVKPVDIPSVYIFLNRVSATITDDDFKGLDRRFKEFINSKPLLRTIFAFANRNLVVDQECVRSCILLYIMIIYQLQFRRFFKVCDDQRFSNAIVNLRSTSLISLYSSHYEIVDHILTSVMRRNPEDPNSLYKCFVQAVNIVRQTLRVVARSYYTNT